jgi:hypothetical protein
MQKKILQCFYGNTFKCFTGSHFVIIFKVCGAKHIFFIQLF